MPRLNSAPVTAPPAIGKNSHNTIVAGSIQVRFHLVPYHALT